MRSWRGSVEQASGPSHQATSFLPADLENHESRIEVLPLGLVRTFRFVRSQPASRLMLPFSAFSFRILFGRDTGTPESVHGRGAGVLRALRDIVQLCFLCFRGVPLDVTPGTTNRIQ